MASGQLFPNGDFENGPGGGCACATGFTCNNDAGRVVDGVHPVWAVGNPGCVTGATNYAPQLGAHGGTSSVYFYAGLDNITSPSINFSGGEEVCLEVWYTGPQGSGASGQNTANAHFSFGIDGTQIGSDILVPVGTPWTLYTMTVTMTAGNHTFSILSGGAAQYSLWFDDFNANICSAATCDSSWTPPVLCSNDAPVDLDTYITGDPGGTWSGTGVTGSMFDPSVGTQSITYTNASPCTSFFTQTITVNQAPTFTLSSTDPTACGTADGSIILSGLPASTSVSISYDDDGVTQGPSTLTTDASGDLVLTALDAGDYDNFSVTINGCTTVDPTLITLSDPGTPTFTFSQTDPGCANNDGSIVISGLVPSTTYDVDYDQDGVGQGTLSLTTDASGDITLSALPAGAYDNWSISLSGCTTTDATVLTLVAPTPAIITVTTTDPSACGLSDGSLTISGLTPGGVYLVSFDDPSGTQGPGSMTADASGNITIPGLSAQSYSNMVVDSSGCVSTSAGPFVLTDPSAPTVDAGVDQTICQGDSVVLSATASSGTISWNNSVVDGVAFYPTVGTTTYTVTADDAGCIVTDQVDVTVLPGPSFSLSSTDPTGCGTMDGTITLSGLTASTAYTLTYEDATGTQGPTAQTSDASGQIVLTGLDAGDYWNWMLGESGCTATDATVITLSVTANVTAQFTTPDTVFLCVGDSALISVDLQGTSPWTLDMDLDGVAQPQLTGVSSSPYTFYTQTGGLYHLSAISDGVGCTGTILGGDVLVVVSTGAPGPTVSGAGTYCAGTPMPDLIAIGLGGNIQWFTDSTLVGFIADGDTLYNVHYDSPGLYDFWAVESIFGCPGTPTQVTVTVLDPGYIDIPDTLHLCLGESVTIDPIGSDTVYWDVLGGSVFGPITVSPALDTLMMAWMNTECGVVSQPVWVFVHPYPVITAGPNQTIALHEQVQLNVTASVDVTWTPATTLSCRNCLDPIASPLETTVYVVTATSEYDCSSTDTVTVFIEGEWEVYVPNVFSPNDDGWNDLVEVQGPPLEGYSFSIYNRWGERVFQSTDRAEMWDGTWRGKPAGQGVYVYSLRATVTTTRTVVEQSGNITLVR